MYLPALAALLATFSSQSFAQAPEVMKKLPRHNERSPLGTNLAPVRDYTSEWSFVDTFKRSRAWISGSAATRGRPGEFMNNQPLDLDEHGWVKSLRPGQMARALLFWTERKTIRYPKGEYVVLYDGRGTLEYTNLEMVERKPGRDVVRADPERGGMAVVITATDPKDYIRNIRVIMPGGVCSNDGYAYCLGDSGCASGGRCISFERNYAEQIFHPTFLDRLKQYSTIRFKDWQDIDNSRQREWKDRPQLSGARWSEKGVPVEVIVDLSNRLSTDAWINVPHLAEDEYIEELARYVEEHLARSLRVYVEHSSDLWNPGAPQSRYAKDRGLGEELAPAIEPWKAAMRWHARRSKKVFEIFARIVPRERLVRVMGGFIGAPHMNEELLTFEGAGKLTDVLAVNPYFPLPKSEIQRDTSERSRTPTADDLFAELRGATAEGISRLIGQQVALAEKHQVALVASEAGEHFAALGSGRHVARLNEVFDAVGRDPRMKATYLFYLDMWKKKGGKLWMHAQPSIYGRFAALEQLDQRRASAPKLDALMEYIEKNPRWW